MEWIYDGLQYINNFFHTWFGVVGTILIFSLVIFFVQMPILIFFQKEWQKRKRIVASVKAYKKSYEEKNKTKEKDDNQKEDADENQMVNILTKKHANYPEQYFEDLTTIVEKEKPKPILALFLLSFSFIFFLTILSFYLTSPMLAYHYLYSVIASVLLIFLFIQRKNIAIRIAFFTLITIAYLRFSADALVLVSGMSFLRLWWKLFQTIKKRE